MAAKCSQTIESFACLYIKTTQAAFDTATSALIINATNQVGRVGTLGYLVCGGGGASNQVTPCEPLDVGEWASEEGAGHRDQCAFRGVRRAGTAGG